MCGIVGLFLKDKSLEPQLGALLSEMLVSLSDRGPDSAGIAIYGSGEPEAQQDHHPVGPPRARFRRPRQASSARGSARPSTCSSNPRMPSSRCPPPSSTKPARRLPSLRPDTRVMGAGEVIEIYKEVGLPGQVVDAFRR